MCQKRREELNKTMEERLTYRDKGKKNTTMQTRNECNEQPRTKVQKAGKYEDRKTLKNYRVARTENGKRTMISPLIKNMTTKREKTDQTGTKCEINVNTIVNKHDQTQHMHQD